MRRSLFQGIAAASLTGLLLGAALRPEVASGDGPSGPQMLAGVSGERRVADTWDFSWTGRTGPLPDYVVGTDWLRPRYGYADEADFAEADFRFDDWIYDEPPEPEPLQPIAEWAMDEGPPPSNPSEAGDILAGVSPPAEPLEETDEPAPPA